MKKVVRDKFKKNVLNFNCNNLIIMVKKNNNLSLFIPRVFKNITAERIKCVFESLEIGLVKRVDMVSRKNRKGEPYNIAFIHFEKWYDNILSKKFKKKVLDPNREATVMYENPWYWVILPNNESNLESNSISKRNNEVPKLEPVSDDPIVEHLERMYEHLNHTVDRYNLILDWTKQQNDILYTLNYRVAVIEDLLNIPPPPPPSPRRRKLSESKHTSRRPNNPKKTYNNISTQTGSNKNPRF